MKPFLLAGYNVIRTICWKLSNSAVRVQLPTLIGYNTRCSFAKGCKVEIAGHLVTDGRFVVIVGKEGSLRIREQVYFNEGGMISCHGDITIGTGCKFGPNVKIFDNNHRFNIIEGVLNSHKTGTISIGDHCWIGTNAVILKGARIGDNCVIGAGCIIDCEIPSNSIVTQQRELEIKPMREA